MRKLIAFLMTVTVCLSLMIMPAMAAEDYPEVGFDFEAFEAQERIDGHTEGGQMEVYIFYISGYQCEG